MNKVCFNLTAVLQGPSEMLELLSSACILNNVRHHTELFEKSNKIKEGKITLNQPQKVWKTFAISIFWRKGGEIFFGKKAPVSKPSVYLFANPFSTWALRWQQNQNSEMILLLIIVLWGIFTYWLIERHLHYITSRLLFLVLIIYTQASHALKP